MTTKWLTWILAGLWLVGGAAAYAQDAEAICAAQGGTLNDQDVCVIQDEGENYRLTVNYPAEFVHDYPFIAETVDEYLRDAATSFTNYASQTPPVVVPGPLTLDILYQTFTHADAIVGIRFTQIVYVGGAGANVFAETYNFDVETEAPLTLDDLFREDEDYLEVIAPLAEAGLVEVGHTIMFEDGLLPTHSNYQHFNLTDDALVFTFRKYQVTIGAAGTPSVAVPLASLEDVLADDIAENMRD